MLTVQELGTGNSLVTLRSYYSWDPEGRKQCPCGPLRPGTTVSLMECVCLWWVVYICVCDGCVSIVHCIGSVVGCVVSVMGCVCIMDFVFCLMDCVCVSWQNCYGGKHYWSLKYLFLSWPFLLTRVSYRPDLGPCDICRLKSATPPPPSRRAEISVAFQMEAWNRFRSSSFWCALLLTQSVLSRPKLFSTRIKSSF